MSTYARWLTTSVFVAAAGVLVLAQAIRGPSSRSPNSDEPHVGLRARKSQLQARSNAPPASAEVVTGCTSRVSTMPRKNAEGVRHVVGAADGSRQMSTSGLLDLYAGIARSPFPVTPFESAGAPDSPALTVLPTREAIGRRCLLPRPRCTASCPRLTGTVRGEDVLRHAPPASRRPDDSDIVPRLKAADRQTRAAVPSADGNRSSAPPHHTGRRLQRRQLVPPSPCTSPGGPQPPGDGYPPCRSHRASVCGTSAG